MVGKNEFEHFVDKMGPPLDNSSLSKYNKVFFHAFINYLQSPSHHLLSSKSRDLFMGHHSLRKLGKKPPHIVHAPKVHDYWPQIST